MIETITVIGAGGRAGSALSARLRERGIRLTDGGELVLLCVPDRAIAEVAAALAPGPWVAHVSGATPLAALAPHERRLCVHPLQTLVHGRGPEQLDGAYAAVTAEGEEARAVAEWLARTLGLEPFPLADAAKPLYHCAASFACAYLSTLHAVAERLFESIGAPPAALVPLERRTMENGFELTGPIARGDWGTVDAQLAALEIAHPELVPLYRELADATVRLAR